MLGLKRALVYAYLVAIVLVDYALTFPYRLARWVQRGLVSASNYLVLKRTVTVDKLDAINEDWYFSIVEREQETRKRAWKEYIKQVNWSEEREKTANKRYNALSASLTKLLDK